jgi:hypothetical protein
MGNPDFKREVKRQKAQRKKGVLNSIQAGLKQYSSKRQGARNWADYSHAV